jgi:hypothetical protein
VRITFLHPRGELSAALVGDCLMLIGLVPPDHIGRWTRNELLLVYDYAMREHAHASDNIVRRRPRPALLEGSRVGDVDFGKEN